MFLEVLRSYCAQKGYPEPAGEYSGWRPGRKNRFDYAWPTLKVALEIEGGIWKRGRHTRGKGYEDDCKKYSDAAILGWLVIRATTGMVESGEVFELVDRAIEARLNMEKIP